MALAVSARRCRRTLGQAAPSIASARWWSSSSSAVHTSSSFGHVRIQKNELSTSKSTIDDSTRGGFSNRGAGARGYATYAMSCGNGDFGRLGHGGGGEGGAGAGLSSDVFRRVTGLPQVWDGFGHLLFFKCPTCQACIAG
jgi:hypothetical protein